MHSRKILNWSVTVALAGFLFGFDTAVISGADKPIQQLWGHSDLFHGIFIMSMALWGTVIGALFGGFPADRLGRKKTLFWIGILYLVSALGSALAPDPYLFSFFRFIGGLGVGASSVAAPTYISEIAPTRQRGRLVATYQLNIVLGILIAYVSNYFLGGAGSHSWRWMLGVEAVPAMAYVLMVVRVPNSPRWLIIRKKDPESARKIMADIGVEDPDAAIAQIQDSALGADGKSIMSRRYAYPLMLAFFIAFFNQLSGINFVIYYAPRILSTTGLAESSALLSTAGIGVVNLVFTLLGMYLIDRSGRKFLMLIGSVGYIISLAMLALSFFAETMHGPTIVIWMLVFIASHAVGQGAVIWVFISEIFPTEVRAKGQAFGTFIHWIFAGAITLLMPSVLSTFSGGPIFAFFAGMMVLQLIFVIFIMPETKGVSLEDLEKKLRIRQD